MFWGLTSRWMSPAAWAASSAAATGVSSRSVRAGSSSPPTISSFSVLPADVAHGEEEAVLGLAGLVDGDDVRVVERRLDLALAPRSERGTSRRTSGAG